MDLQPLSNLLNQHLRLVTPQHLEVVLADDVLGIGKARAARELLVAAQVDELLVLPEHAARNRVDDAVDQLLGPFP